MLYCWSAILLGVVESARERQVRIEHWVKRVQNWFVGKTGCWHWKKQDSLFFFLFFMVCYGVMEVMLFQIVIFGLYESNYWLIPCGMGTLSLFFFFASHNKQVAT